MHDLTAMMVEGEEGEQELELPPIRQGEVGYYDYASITVVGEGGGGAKAWRTECQTLGSDKKKKY